MSKRRRGESSGSERRPPAEVHGAPGDRSASDRIRDSCERARLGDPATLLAMLVAAACLVFSVTLVIRDYDLWQHLVIGKTIWQTHGVPKTDVWSWAFQDQPPAMPQAWGFRALLWPFWSAGGVVGLYAWRWLMVLATFGFVWAAARTAGARGLAALPVLILASLTYRLHVRVGPESVALLLLAIELWLLARRRFLPRPPGRGLAALDPAVWIVPLAWVWANVHDTWWLGVVVVVIALIDGALGGSRTSAPARGVAARGTGTLALVALAAIAISLLNPFGWSSLRQPFVLLLHGPGDVVVRSLWEYQPIAWGAHWRSGLPLLVIGWPILIAWRALGSRLDWGEALACASFTSLLFVAQRFAPFFAVIAAFYVARDVDAVIGALRRRPAWLRSGSGRAGVVAAACVAIGLLEWTRPESAPGASIDMSRFPVEAADFIAAHDIRGRGFMPASLAGYHLYRFWPDQGRRAFLDHPFAGSPKERAQAAFAFSTDEAWRDLHKEHQFDYVLLDGHQESGSADRLLDVLDADSSWSLVFRDDAAVVYVHCDGSLAPVAQRLGYFFVPGGDARIPTLGRAATIDTTIRRLTENELMRQIESSPHNSRARALLATLAWIDSRPEDARRELEAALAVNPRAAGVHQRLGLMALSTGHPEEAVREFEREMELHPTSELAFFLGRGYHRLGDDGKARKWYRKSFELDPKNEAARDSLAALERRPRP